MFHAPPTPSFLSSGEEIVLFLAASPRAGPSPRIRWPPTFLPPGSSLSYPSSISPVFSFPFHLLSFLISPVSLIAPFRNGVVSAQAPSMHATGLSAQTTRHSTRKRPEAPANLRHLGCYTGKEQLHREASSW